MANQNKNQKRYSLPERRAYYMGMGAWLGRCRRIKETADKMSPVEKQSFYNGLDDAIIMRWKNNKKGR